jgi:23S rRNA pseudouridine1911/1915/1917 synthase
VSERRFQIEVAPPGDRLDLVLVAHIPDISRTRLQRLIRAGLVVVDGVPVTKVGFRLEGGEIVEARIPTPKPYKLQAEPIPLNVVYEDSNLILVNKPAGMVVHPSAGHDTGTLVHAVLAHSPDIEGIGGEIRPGVIHRLDKETSGLIILAKNDQTHQAIQEQFKAREVEKAYLALVEGHPPTPEGRIETPIGRDPRRRKRMTVRPPGKGREAITIYRTLERFPEHSLLEVRPLTGRTHQIRVHMAYLGCPIAGDRVYGRRKSKLPIKRHFLHASRLTFRFPGEKEARLFEAPLPSDLGDILEKVRHS